MIRLRIADYNFKISNHYKYVESLCKDYMISDSDVVGDEEYIVINVTEDDILSEQHEGENYSKPYLESLAVYRKISEYLVHRDILLFHCSAIMVDGQALLFTAPSGTGKSTHAGIWRKVYGDRVTMINDDKPLIKVDSTGSTVYGTPWCGKHGRQNNISAPVKAVFVLSRGDSNKVHRITKGESFPIFLNQTYRSKAEDSMRRTLSLVNTFSSSVSIYSLQCNMEDEAAITAYGAAFGE